MVQAVSCAISKVLTDNGVQFTQLPHRRSPMAHLFDAVCAAHAIEHRCTQVARPWTNERVERLNHTLKETTVQQYHYQNAAEPNAHLQTFYKHLMRLYVPNSPKILVSLYETQPMTLRDYTLHKSPVACCPRPQGRASLHFR